MTTVNNKADDNGGPAFVSQPTFLVGAERSGTTLLRLMLGHHPQIAFHFEFDFCVGHLPPDAGFPEMGEYRRWLRTQYLFGAVGYQIDDSLAYVDLMNSFLRQAQRVLGNKPIMGTSVHHDFDRLPRVWPDAKYIHLIRDGRDVARSAIDMGWVGNAWDGATLWIDAMATWKRLVAKLNRENYLEIRYHDLIRNPVDQLTRICEFMGTAYHPAMLEYHQDSTYSAPDVSMLEQWKRKLTPREVQTVESRIAPLLQEYKFELSGQPVVELSAAEKKWLLFQSWFGKLRFRIRRFGLPLFTLDFLARRVPLLGWLQAWTRKKMWAVTIKHLK